MSIRVEDNYDGNKSCQLGDIVQAVRLNKRHGIQLKDSVGHLVSDEILYQMVREDVTAKWRPPSGDWRDTEAIKAQKLDAKVQETFEKMMKGGKVNKLIKDSFV